MFLYQKMDVRREDGNIASLPSYISDNMNPTFELRPYQIEAFENFITYYENDNRPRPTQVLFHMATGSGKTLIMAGIMLYLFKQGYRNFLFFVNRTNIIEKTKTNFMNKASTKYLFSQDILINGERVRVNQVTNFQYTDKDAINICFTTTQELHFNMWLETGENRITFDDFEGEKVVLISDEAHHLNVDTKGKLSKDEEDSYHSWEETVKNIFNRNSENVLLEFTATCDLENKAISAAYENKIIFNYPLTNFYNDKYSKDIIMLRSDIPIMDRALQAIVLSQYRMKVFQDHRLAIKPVVLFKEKNIPQNKEFMENFNKMIQALDGTKLANLKDYASNNEIMEKAFIYFEYHGISLENLAVELKDDFSEDHCILVDCKQSDSEKSRKLVLLNSLEDINNSYRAVFAVDMLNEGWDVLNLFDIVRLDEKRQSGGSKISAATIAEAQLIGRGARYCPFQTNKEQPKFQRKYDDDLDNELRVCETLYYHCQNESRYVAELKQALRDIGLDIDKKVTKKYVLKDDFKSDELYKEGLVFINDKYPVDRNDVYGLNDSTKRIYHYRSKTGTSGLEALMEDDVRIDDNNTTELKTVRMAIKDIAKINYALIHKALMQYPIYKFNVLKSYFPNLSSIREFIFDDNYLGSIVIEIQSLEALPSVKTLYDAALKVLGEIATSISEIEETYKGTHEFYARRIRDIFKDKTVNYTDPHGEGIGISQNSDSVRTNWKIDLSKEDWFAYTDNYGTSEEKAFVAYFKDYVDELKKNYNKVYLLRNEREFHLYSFNDGNRFEPDYVLLLQKNKTNGYEQMQIFIEPKGTHLLGTDIWKEKFLLQMKEEAIPVKIFVDDNDYKIWGLHFFNTDNRMPEFDADFLDVIEGH